METLRKRFELYKKHFLEPPPSTTQQIYWVPTILDSVASMENVAYFMKTYNSNLDNTLQNFHEAYYEIGSGLCSDESMILEFVHDTFKPDMTGGTPLGVHAPYGFSGEFTELKEQGRWF
jgi:hypothetical protein